MTNTNDALQRAEARADLPVCIYADQDGGCAWPATMAGYCETHARVGSDQAQDLQRAVEYLGAKEVAPGYFAYQDKGNAAWYVMPGCDVLTVYRYIHEKQPKTTMAWGELGAVKMPSWWSPGRQISTRMRDEIQGDEHVIYREIFTADLTTGEEIPA